MSVPTLNITRTGDWMNPGLESSGAARDPARQCCSSLLALAGIHSTARVSSRCLGTVLKYFQCLGSSPKCEATWLLPQWPSHPAGHAQQMGPSPAREKQFREFRLTARTKSGKSKGARTEGLRGGELTDHTKSSCWGPAGFCQEAFFIPKEVLRNSQALSALTN